MPYYKRLKENYMQKKADTPERIRRRQYEETHKAERIERNKVWATSIPRADAEMIDGFLKKHHLTKVDLIYVGLGALIEQYRKE
jgi:hypothetical protein